MTVSVLSSAVLAAGMEMKNSDNGQAVASGDDLQHLGEDSDTARLLRADADAADADADGPHSTDSESIPTPAPVPPARTQVPWFAWVALAIACCAMAAVGPTFKYLSALGVPPILSGVWRMQTMLMALLVPCLAETAVYARRKPRGFYRDIVCSRFAAWTVLAGVLWSVSLSLWLVALSLTTTVRASLFSSLSPLALLGWIRIRGQAISRGEILGVAVGTLGIAIVSFGSLISSSSAKQGQDQQQQESWSMMLLGDSLSLVVSVVLAARTLLGSKTRQRVPLLAYSFSANFVALVLMSLTSVAMEHADLSDRPPRGLFSWVDPQFLLLVLVFGILVGMLGILGFNIAIRHVSPLLYALAQLIDPVLTAVFVAVSGIEAIPSAWTFVGGLVLLFGVALVIYFEDLRKQRQTQPTATELQTVPSDAQE